MCLLLLLLLLLLPQSSLMWNQEVLAAPELAYPKGLYPNPLLLLHVTEGQINEPRREDARSSESNTSAIETLPEEIPDELGREWRVLHPFELPGVRFPMESTPPNQRRLAENDALVELIQTTEYLDDVPTWGQRDYRLYPLSMVIPSTEEEVEEEVEAEEDKNGFKKDKWTDQMEDLEEDFPVVME